MTEEYTRKGSIYRHISGAFRIRERKGRAFEVEYSERPSLWISTGTKVFGEADAFAQNHLHAQRRFLPGEKVKLMDFAEGFFMRNDEGSYRERCRLFGKTHDENYFRQMEGRLENYIITEFGGWDISMITDVDIEDWYIALESRRYPGELLSADARNKVLIAFSIVMKEAKRRGLIQINPCDTVERIAIRKEESKARRIFTSEEINALFPDDRAELMRIWDGSLMWALYFSIMVDTGWRPGEVSAIEKSSLRLENGSYGLYSTSSINTPTRSKKNRIKTTGKGKGEKFGLLSSYTARLLEDYLTTLSGEMLFMTETGYIYTPIANFNLRKACLNAGVDIGERTQYCFRHTFDTYMLNNLGQSIEESDVRDLMAHTGYRPEYDHRTPEQILFRLQKVRPAIEKMRATI